MLFILDTWIFRESYLPTITKKAFKSFQIKNLCCKWYQLEAQEIQLLLKNDCYTVLITETSGNCSNIYIFKNLKYNI